MFFFAKLLLQLGPNKACWSWKAAKKEKRGSEAISRCIIPAFRASCAVCEGVKWKTCCRVGLRLYRRRSRSSAPVSTNLISGAFEVARPCRNGGLLHDCLPSSWKTHRAPALLIHSPPLSSTHVSLRELFSTPRPHADPPGVSLQYAVRAAPLTQCRDPHPSSTWRAKWKQNVDCDCASWQ